MKTQDNASQPEIMAVDDSLANLNLLVKILSAEGYKVRPANSGALALASVAADRPDLILLDIKLPDIDGYEVCKRLKALPGCFDIPVIFLSALDDTKDKIKGFSAGGVDYISKPFVPQEVLARVETHLKLRNLQIELTKTNASLYREKQRLEITLYSIGDGVISIDKYGKVEILNEVAQKLTGWSIDDARGKHFNEVFNIINEHTREKAENPFSKVLETGRISGLANHTLLISKDGTERPIDDIAAPIKDGDGNIYGVILVFRDVTERKKAEQALEESNKKAQRYLDVAAEIIFSLDKAGNITLLNSSGHKLLGYNNNELIGKNWFETCLPDEVKVDVYGVFKKIMNGDVESVKNYENEVKTKGGELKTILWHNSALVDSSGNITGLVSSGEDITERKMAEKLLTESEERYRTLFNTSHEGIIIMELETNKFKYVNPIICKMLGYSEKELTEMENTAIHPKEYLLSSNTNLQDQIRGINPLAKDVPCLRKDGTIFYVDINSAPIVVDGKKCIAGFFHDITERKKTEEEILYLSYHDQLTGLYNRRFFEEELKRLDTKRQLPISIIMADVDGLKYVNDSYGHEKGDKLLIATSEIIKNSCRKEDIIARIGGDEFIIFLPKTKEKDALDAMDRIRKASKVYKLEDKINISISLGLSTKKDLNENMEHIIEQADKNMYADKASKKNNKDIG